MARNLPKYEYYGDESIANARELTKTIESARVINRSEMSNTCENFGYLMKNRAVPPNKLHNFFASRYKGRLCKFFKSNCNTYLWVKSNL
jgi:hypothetical protein